jgi:hypothetical protein
VGIRAQSGLGRVAPGLRVMAAVLITVGAGVSGWAAQSPAHPTSDTQAARWRADLDYLATQLAAGEDPQAFDADQARFSRDIAALQAQAASATNDQMIVGILEAVASFGVAHTQLYVPPFPTYPIKLDLFGDGFHVVDATSPYKNLLGALLVRIGDTPAQVAYQRVSAVISHENQARLAYVAPKYLTIPTILDGLGILTNGHDDLTFRTLSGTTLTVSLPAVPYGQYPPLDQLVTHQPLYLQHLDEPFWFTYLPAEQTLYVRYLDCTDPAGFAALTDQVFALAATHPVQRLVVDLRQNEGGDTAVFAPFLQRLQTSPLDHAGRLYAVIDQGTFSSGMDTAIELASAGATLIGSPTGGKPDSYGEIGTFTLPNSGLTFSYATQYFQAAAPGTDPASLMPSITIQTTFAQYAAGEDPVMNAILATVPAGRLS